MQLPIDFQFSQSSLQDYVECQRRFQLRHLMRLAYPAVEVEPILEKEDYLRQGATFHRILHQHQMGLPVEREINNAKLRLWWENFQRLPPPDLPTQRYPEISLSMKLTLPKTGEGVNLMAKYDLIALEPGKRAVIVDWKTSPKRPKREWLAHQLQTRVYRYLLVKAGISPKVKFAPEQVEMIYWFANFPENPERFPYDQAQFEADEKFLLNLMQDITTRNINDFALTDDLRRCRFCLYRSLCERGREIGTVGEAEDLLENEDDAFAPIMDLEF